MGLIVAAILFILGAAGFIGFSIGRGMERLSKRDIPKESSTPTEDLVMEAVEEEAQPYYMSVYQVRDTPGSWDVRITFGWGLNTWLVLTPQFWAGGDVRQESVHIFYQDFPESINFATRAKINRELVKRFMPKPWSQVG